MAKTDDTLGNLALSRTGLDRSAHERRDPGLVATLLSRPDTRVVEVRGDRLQVEARDDGETRLVTRPPAAGDAALLGVHLGRDSGSAAYVAVIVPVDPVREAAPVDPSEHETEERWLSLREVGAALDDRDAGIFTTSVALANWHAAHPHCPRCGQPTEPTQGGWVRQCPGDGSEHYPRTDPAVIMSVVDPDDRLLLGRGAHWPEGRFSVLAGFVEPGESFESAVAREVLEEVGIAVDDVHYLGNQPWPFPSSVMIGFAATTRQTELTLDETEMAEARWVTRADYRAQLRSGTIRTPSGISIAKRIIERWLGETVESVVRGPAPEL